MIDINHPWVKVYFRVDPTNQDRWICTNGNDLYGGIRYGWCAMNGSPRLPTGPEVRVGKSAVYRMCEGGIILYDPAKEFDAPGGPWGDCYLVKLDSPLAKQLLSIGNSQINPAIATDLASAAAALASVAVSVKTASDAVSDALGKVK